MNPRLSDASLVELNLALVRAGFVTLVPISLMVLVFGAAFGLAAAQKGMGPLDAMLMSAIVFAGVAQFAALDVWGTQVPVFTLAATVFAINARHILMGASLYPWLQHTRPSHRYGVMVLASDVNWAMAMQAFGKGQQAMGILLGGGLAWVFFAFTAVTALRTASLKPQYLGFVVLGSWLIKIILLLFVLAWLRGEEFYSRPAFFATLLIATFAMLTFEALITLKTRVPYVDPER